MIQIDTVTEVPQDVLQDLTPFSLAEWTLAAKAGDILVEQSDVVMIGRDEFGKPLIVLGLLKERSLCGTQPDAWAMLCNNLVRRPYYFRRLRSVWGIIQSAYPILRTHAHCKHKDAQRMLRFFGFVPVKQEGDYFIYEARV